MDPLDDEDVTSTPRAPPPPDDEETALVNRHATSNVQRGKSSRVNASLLVCCLVVVALAALLASAAWAPASSQPSARHSAKDVQFGCEGDLVYSACVPACGLTCARATDGDCDHPCWEGCTCASDKPYFAGNRTCVAALDQCPQPTRSPTGNPTSRPTEPTSAAPTRLPTAPDTRSPTAMQPWAPVNAPGFTDFSSCGQAPGPVAAQGKFLAMPARTVVDHVRLGISPCPASADVTAFFIMASAQSCALPAQDFKVWYALRGDAGEASGLLAASTRLVCHPSGAAFVHYYSSRLARLQPGKMYVYELGVLHEAGANRTLSRRDFQAPLLPGDAAAAGNAGLVVGDTGFRGGGNGFPAMRGMRDREQLGLMLHVGDQSYATNNGACWGHNEFGEPNKVRRAGGWGRAGKLTQCVRRVQECGWNCSSTKCIFAGRLADYGGFASWTRAVDESLGGRVVWMTTMGNHDNDPGWFFANRPPILAALPGVAPEAFPGPLDALRSLAPLPGPELMVRVAEYLREPFFYSFDYGG
jgi:hypothetical protein